MPLPPFLAFDTETATPNGEICAIAVVRFEDGEVAQSWWTLVNPGVPIWSRFTEIHRITNRQAMAAPMWAEVWRNWQSHFSGALPVVAHNAAFDAGVLRRNVAACGAVMPAFPLHCTVRMARKLWPQLPNHKLSTVAAHLRLELNHHEALSDALACGRIAAAGLRAWGRFEQGR